MILGIDASRAVTTQRTGTEAYAYFLIRALIPLASEYGLRLRLYFNQPPPADLFPHADHVETVNIPFARLWTHVRLAQELRRHPPDLFFTPAHVIPWTYRHASCATIHDLGYHYFPEAHTRRQSLYLRWSTRHNCRVSDFVIADSLATKNDLVSLYALDPEHVQVVYPGIDPDLKPVTDVEALTAVQYKFGITAPYLLYIGTLQPRKNLLRLIQAYAQSNIQHALVIAGKKGWLSQPILEAVWALPLSIQQRILLPGFVAEEDKAALLSGAAALLFPSLYEGFGFPVLEGQACGVPVLTSNSSSLPEVAGNGALLVDPLDTNQITAGLQRIVEDEALRTELVQHGFENVGRFTWQETAVALLNSITSSS